MSTHHLKVSGGFAVKLKQEVLLKLSMQRSWGVMNILHVHRLAGSVENKRRQTFTHCCGHRISSYLLTFHKVPKISVLTTDLCSIVTVQFQEGGRWVCSVSEWCLMAVLTLNKKVCHLQAKISQDQYYTSEIVFEQRTRYFAKPDKHVMLILGHHEYSNKGNILNCKLSA